MVEHLAKDLQNSFPGMKRFSARNLWKMRDFYQSYYQNEKLTALLAEISWTHRTISINNILQVKSAPNLINRGDLLPLTIAELFPV